MSNAKGAALKATDLGPNKKVKTSRDPPDNVRGNNQSERRTPPQRNQNNGGPLQRKASQDPRREQAARRIHQKAAEDVDSKKPSQGKHKDSLGTSKSRAAAGPLAAEPGKGGIVGETAKGFLRRLKNKYSDEQNNSGSNAESDTDHSPDKAREAATDRKAASSPGKSKTSRLQSTNRDDDGWETQEDDRYESSEHYERSDGGSGSTSWESDEDEEHSGSDHGSEHDAQQENGHHEHSDIHVAAGYEESASGPEERYWRQEGLGEHGQDGSGELEDEAHPEPHNDHYLVHGDGSYPDLRAGHDYGPEWEQQHKEKHQGDHYAEGVIYDEDPSYAGSQSFVEERRDGSPGHVTHVNPAYEEATYLEHGYQSHQKAGFEYQYQYQYQPEAGEEEYPGYEAGYEDQEACAHVDEEEEEGQYEGQQYDEEQQYEEEKQYEQEQQYDEEQLEDTQYSEPEEASADECSIEAPTQYQENYPSTEKESYNYDYHEPEYSASDPSNDASDY